MKEMISIAQTTKADIIKQSQDITDFAEDNLQQLEGLCEKQEQEQDYYLGLIRRQSVFNMDINVVIKYFSK